MFIIQTALQFPPNDRRKILNVTALSRLAEQLPPLLIAECPQFPLNTRPPVPVDSHFLSSTSPVSRANHPIIPIEVSGDSASPRRVRSRRRRGKLVIKERPQPTFWRPDPAVGGKSLGYALGYPGSWAPYKQGSRRRERDTMRKGILADAVLHTIKT
jgi:hypothetical protein